MKRGKRRHLNLITKVRCSQSPIRLHFYSISYIIQIILICFQAFYFSPLGTYRWECRILPVTSMESPSNFSVLISVSQGIKTWKQHFQNSLAKYKLDRFSHRNTCNKLEVEEKDIIKLLGLASAALGTVGALPAVLAVTAGWLLLGSKGGAISSFSSNAVSSGSWQAMASIHRWEYLSNLRVLLLPCSSTFSHTFATNP